MSCSAGLPAMGTSGGFFWRAQASPDKLAYLARYAVPQQVLDIGCGAGWYSRFLAQRGLSVFSVDIARDRAGRPLANFSLAGGTALPFPGQSFDTVLALDVLEHIPDEALALAELARVARHRVILSVPYSDDSVLYPYGLSLLHRIDKTHAREYMPDELTRKLFGAGFGVVDCHLAPAPQMPLVIREFFRSDLISRQLRRLTSLWIRLLMRFDVIANGLPGDIFCVADRTAVG
jgi:SAM-dependent methyltransferase